MCMSANSDTCCKRDNRLQWLKLCRMTAAITATADKVLENCGRDQSPTLIVRLISSVNNNGGDAGKREKREKFPKTDNGDYNAIHSHGIHTIVYICFYVYKQVKYVYILYYCV